MRFYVKDYAEKAVVAQFARVWNKELLSVCIPAALTARLKTLTVQFTACIGGNRKLVEGYLLRQQDGVEFFISLPNPRSGDDGFVVYGRQQPSPLLIASFKLVIIEMLDWALENPTSVLDTQEFAPITQQMLDQIELEELLDAWDPNKAATEELPFDIRDLLDVDDED